MNSDKRAAAFRRVEELTELPMLVLSLVMLPLLLLPLTVDLSDSARNAFLAADWFIWALFGVELIVKTYLAPARVAYLTSHWFDILIVVVPFLRPLRVARSARLLRLARASRVVAFVARSANIASSILDQHGLKYVLTVALLVVFAASAAVTIFEKDAGGNIEHFADGLWWAFSTITTVGYGDRFPTTPEGRGIAVFLMLLGITLFSVVTANIAAYLVRPRPEVSGASLDDVLTQLKSLELEVQGLRRALASREVAATEAVD